MYLSPPVAGLLPFQGGGSVVVDFVHCNSHCGSL